MSWKSFFKWPRKKKKAKILLSRLTSDNEIIGLRLSHASASRLSISHFGAVFEKMVNAINFSATHLTVRYNASEDDASRLALLFNFRRTALPKITVTTLSEGVEYSWSINGSAYIPTSRAYDLQLYHIS